MHQHSSQQTTSEPNQIRQFYLNPVPVVFLKPPTTEQRQAYSWVFLVVFVSFFFFFGLNSLSPRNSLNDAQTFFVPIFREKKSFLRDITRFYAICVIL